MLFVMCACNVIDVITIISFDFFSLMYVQRLNINKSWVKTKGGGGKSFKKNPTKAKKKRKTQGKKRERRRRRTIEECKN